MKSEEVREEIKPCPFCGRVAYYPTKIKKNKSITGCSNGNCRIYGIKFTVKEWNTRHEAKK